MSDLYYDKNEIKAKLTTDQIFQILQELGGNPTWKGDNIISDTICHNHPGEGSHKLYYYPNDGLGLFRCYTGCDSTFDIFELISKTHNNEWNLYDSMTWVASKYGFGPKIVENDKNNLVDWLIFNRYEKINTSSASFQKETILQEYDITILKNLSYPIIAPWEHEGIKRNVIRRNLIGYYPTKDQITIPHFDINGRFVGLRGRTLIKEEEQFGKYRPLIISGKMYNHALGLNLYNINNSKDNIKKYKSAVIFESEKSTLQYQSYFGIENDISVACCGSSISAYQMDLLIGLGAKEISIAFDRQFQEKNDNEFRKLVKNLRAIHEKYGHFTTISFLFDKDNKLPYKASPTDIGPETYLYLYKNRIIL